jgi:protein phosphatase
MLYEEGTITSEEKKSHSHRNIILPVIGNLDEDPNPELKIYPEGLQYGDLLLLCSDGLTDYVSNTEIEAILAQPKKMQDRLSMLVSLALKKGGTDNITIIAIVRYPDDIPIPSV